jgi:hypothetical protein
MTKVIFDKLHVDAEDIGGHDLAEGFRGLIEGKARSPKLHVTARLHQATNPPTIRATPSWRKEPLLIG